MLWNTARPISWTAVGNYGREERWIRRSTTTPSIAPLAGLVVAEIDHSVAAPYAGMVSPRRL
jgi:hypothetical protein